MYPSGFGSDDLTGRVEFTEELHVTLLPTWKRPKFLQHFLPGNIFELRAIQMNTPWDVQAHS